MKPWMLAPRTLRAARSMPSINRWVANTTVKVTAGRISVGITALESTVVRSETGSDFQNSTLRSRRSAFRAPRQ